MYWLSTSLLLPLLIKWFLYRDSKSARHKSCAMFRDCGANLYSSTYCCSCLAMPVVQVVTYDIKGGFKPVLKKTFQGHTVAGYPCEVSYSPDGKYLISGDAQGRVLFWDWRFGITRKLIKSFEHSVCMGATWNPVDSHSVAMCGLNGVIKYWA